MPQEVSGKNRKLALPYHGPYWVCEVHPNCVIVRQVDKPEEEPILVSMDCVVRCSDQLPDMSCLEKKTRPRRQRRQSHRYSLLRENT